MDRADLSRLSDVDFEAVVADLYESLLGLRLELFAPGADKGIDARHFKGHNRLVIQCKHWLKTGGAKLVKEVRDKELPKIQALKPSRYILVTSADLSVGQKDTLFETLTPYVVSRDDIVGARDLVKDLNRHPEVVRRHLRIWLSSDDVLRAAVQRPTAVRSSALVDEIREAVRVWVDVSSRERARQLLENHHVVVIAGIPGIGKSTLARVLCAEYAEHEKYEIVDVSQDIDEANGFWSDRTPQVFFFDDFLGQTTLREKLGHNADSRLVRFMNRIRRDPTKRLVLTTREYILADARRNHEMLDRTAFDLWTCVVPLSDYTPELRARLVYNHVYFSDLPTTSKRAFADIGASLAIVEHPNFNPRLLDAALQQASQRGAPSDEIVDLVKRSFDQPATLWDHIVRNQLDDHTRALLHLLAVLPTPTSWDELNECYRSLRADLPDRALERAIRATEGNLTITRRANGETTVALHNPSILDFMTEELGRSELSIPSLLRTTSRFELVFGVWRLRDDLGVAAALDRHLELFIEAVARTVDAPPLQNSWGTYRLSPATTVDWADRAALLAPMAKDMDRQELWELLARALDAARPIDHRLTEVAEAISRSDNAVAQESLFRLFERARAALAASRIVDISDVATLVDSMNAVDAELIPEAARSLVAAHTKTMIEEANPDPTTISDELEQLAYAVVEGRWPEVDSDLAEYFAYNRERPTTTPRRPVELAATNDNRAAVARALAALADAE